MQIVVRKSNSGCLCSSALVAGVATTTLSANRHCYRQKTNHQGVKDQVLCKNLLQQSPHTHGYSVGISLDKAVHSKVFRNTVLKRKARQEAKIHDRQ
ncbi:hypothetical protein STEG23_022206, partial [Scotinomys teguina]